MAMMTSADLELSWRNTLTAADPHQACIHAHGSAWQQRAAVRHVAASLDGDGRHLMRVANDVRAAAQQQSVGWHCVLR